MPPSLIEIIDEYVLKREQAYKQKAVQYFSEEYIQFLKKLNLEDRARMLDEFQQMHYQLQKSETNSS